MSNSQLESALRWLATRKHAKPFGLLVHAIEDPRGVSAAQLKPLLEPTASLPDGNPETRALAVWGLIIAEINKVGSTGDSRRRNALAAAFRLPRRPEVTDSWKSTLRGRFDQLMALPEVFGNPPPTTTTPMHKAWSDAVGNKLTPALRERLDKLATNGAAWEPYIAIGRESEDLIAQEHATFTPPVISLAGYRPPSRGAQPVFLDMFVTTVYMRGRGVYRRITERLVTARADGVDGYLASALVGSKNNATDVPVRAIWGCRAERVSSPPGSRDLTKLWFPRTLHNGQKHHFVSESIVEDLTEERLGVNVEVDHFGIAPGQLLHGCLPISGLTIRIRFDESCLPEACWWYAEQTTRERLQRPPDDDPHLLTLTGSDIMHTFTQKCHPRETYGVSFSWPSK